MEETGSEPGNKQGFIPLISIGLKLKGNEIVVDGLIRLSGPNPPGQISLTDEVPASIIGHWVEISTANSEVIYRRYVQKSLPLNLEHADSRLQRIYAHEKYRILVPDLPKGHILILYEQSLPKPGTKIPLKRTRLKLGLIPSIVTAEELA